MELTTYPNQRQIAIHKCDGKKKYSKIDIAANLKAMNTLGYSAYMMYMRLCMNATGFKMILSKAIVCDETSLTKNTYYAAFAKLEEKGYLVQRPNTECLFDFYEDPDLASGRPETGKVRTEKRESESLKQAENIKEYIENTARGGAGALPAGDGKEEQLIIAVNKKHVFADI